MAYIQLKEGQAWLKIIASKELKEKFKTLCWAKNTNMTDKLLKFMENEVNSNQKLLEEVENLRGED